MAGDWIKWTKGLAKKPEVMQIAGRLGLTRHAVAGLLMEVWEWADDNAVLKLSGCEPDSSAGSVRFSGRTDDLFAALTGVSGVADAMREVGWLSDENGVVAFPNFGRHNGKPAKSRALDTARKRTSRDPAVRKVSGSQPDKSRTREEKRREEKKEMKEGSSNPLSPADKPPKGEKRPRQPDPLFDAIAEVTGSDPKATGSHIAKVRHLLAAADPPYTPDEVRRLADPAFVAVELSWLNGRRPTLGEVEKFIGRVRNRSDPATKPAQVPRSKVDQQADYMARMMVDAAGGGNP